MNHDLQALLIRTNLVDHDQVLDAVRATRGTDATWLDHLLSTGALDEDHLARLVAAAGRLQRCEPPRLRAVPAEALACLPADVAVEHRVVPVAIDGDGYLVVAMLDPTDEAAIEEIAFFSSRPLLREVATASAITWALHHYYGEHTVLCQPTSPTWAGAEIESISAVG